MHCKNVKELKCLAVGRGTQTEENDNETEGTTQQGRRSSTRLHANREKNTAPADGETANEAPTNATTANVEEAASDDIEYKESPIKIPAPFLTITAFACNSTNPLDIIIATKNAAVEFSDSHMEADNFNYKDLSPSATNLIKWLFAVHMGLITET